MALWTMIYMQKHREVQTTPSLMTHLPPLKTSSNNAGYWKVGIVKNGSSNPASWKYKAFHPRPPTSPGCMITEEDGGGNFDTAIEAAGALRTYCMSHDISY